MITVSQLKEILDSLPHPDSYNGDVLAVNVDSLSDVWRNPDETETLMRVIKLKKVKNYSSANNYTVEWGILDMQNLY